MNDKFLLGGYFIVIPSLRAEYMNEDLVPKKIVSVSECICEVVPGPWALGWVNNREQDISRIMDTFNLNKDEFLDLEKWVTNEFDNGYFGWQHGFSELQAAKKFAELFMSKVGEFLIISIGLSENDSNVLLEEEAPQGNMGSTLVYDVLSKGKELKINRLLGYDLLGYDMGGFHSYLCNGLENDIEKQFGIKPNAYGFYDCYELLARAAEYISDDEIGAEPVLWQSWVICLEDYMTRQDESF